MVHARAGTVLRHLCHLIRTPAADALPDEQLLQRFVGRHEEAAFAALVRRHGAMVFNLCRRVLRHAQDAEDAFQATFLVLARRAASIRKHESIGSWLHRGTCPFFW